MANGQTLPWATEQDLLVRHQPREPDTVDLHASGRPCTARAVDDRGLCRITALVTARRCSCCGDALGGLDRGPRRSISLRSMMQLDHLDTLEIGRSDLGESHGQHGAECEVRRHEKVPRTRQRRRFRRCHRFG